MADIDIYFKHVNANVTLLLDTIKIWYNYKTSKIKFKENKEQSISVKQIKSYAAYVKKKDRHFANVLEIHN